MKNKPLISVVINVHNEGEYLKKCLESVKGLADEIIIVDMNSTDNSREIAQSFKAKIFSYKFVKFVEPARNYGLSKANGKWILLLDPDESITKQLKNELLRTIKRPDVDWVKIPRKNIVFGKWLRHSRMWPDYLIRFFKKDAVKWHKEIHSQPTTSGPGITMLDSENLAIRHHHYKNINHFIHRALRYSQVQAEELSLSNYKLKLSDLILKPIQEFNSRFYFAEGFKDGFHGLVYCLLQSIAIFLIYAKLWEMQGMEDKVLSKESFVSASLESNYEYSYWFTKFFSHEYTANPIKRMVQKLRHNLLRLTKDI